MVLSYYFTVKEIRRHESAPPRYSRRGWILPAKAYGYNIAEKAAHFEHFNGQTTVIDAIPANAEEHKSYSAYIYNATVWTIDYDATIKQVHDGRDTSEGNGETPEGGDQPSVLAGLAESDVHDDPEDEDDWVSMSFSHLENYMSYVGRRREHWRLCADRSDQQWSKLMLPDAYMAQTEAENANHGGLIGDLPLLIGLLALSVPEEEVEAMLSRVMLDPWRFSLSDPSKRSDGWWDGRGVVVTVYADIVSSSFKELKQYECGSRGAILP